jgi:hypothetical protein
LTRTWAGAWIRTQAGQGQEQGQGQGHEQEQEQEQEQAQKQEQEQNSVHFAVLLTYCTCMGHERECEKVFFFHIKGDTNSGSKEPEWCFHLSSSLYTSHSMAKKIQYDGIIESSDSIHLAVSTWFLFYCFV